MKTFDEFRAGLNFPNVAGSSRSFDDVKALRDILVDEAQRLSSLLGRASSLATANDQWAMSEELEHHKGWIVGLFEADIMAIDAYLRMREK